MKKELSIKKALIELYSSIKKYYNNKTKKKEDLEYLLTLNEITLIKYIKDSIDITISILAEKKANEYNFKILKENIKQDYESLLIKYEQDIRGHIKTEHQLKLYTDSLQNNIEDLEKEKKEFNDIINIKNNEINKIKKELNNYKKAFEIQNNNYEKKIKNDFLKLEKKYKNEIESLNKKINYYQRLFMEDNENNEKEIDNKIYCNSSRLPISSNRINNYLKNEKANKSYRNMNNNFTNNNSMNNSHPYVKKEKSIKKKLNYNKNSSNAEYSLGKKRNNNIYIPNNNNSFIIDSKVKHQTINKLIINDSSLNDNKKSKRIYHRHKSIENNSNKCVIKNKPLNIIKRILISSNNCNMKNSFNNINKVVSNSYINFKNELNSNNNNTNINFNKTFINRNLNENIKNKKPGFNCDFNINKLKDNNGIYIKTNIYRKSGNYSERDLGNKKINNPYNYIHIHEKKENMINFRNKSKDNLNSSYTNNFF